MSSLFQAAQTDIGGLGWDGAQYVQLASQCGRGPMSAIEPFVYRIGVPCVAALLPMPPKQALWTVNVAASVVLLFLLDVWLTRHVSPRTRAWLLVFFAFHWLAPLRYVWWYPTLVDTAFVCMVVAGLLLKDRPVWIGVVCIAGGLIRETMPVVPVAFLAGSLWRRYGSPRKPATPVFVSALTGLAGCALAAGLTRALVSATTDYWMLDSALYWAYEKPLPRYLHALFLAFGPAIVLVAAFPGAVRRYVRDAPEDGALLALILILAWVGGIDTERFLLWGAPVALVLVGRAAEHLSWRRDRGPILLLLVTQAIGERWFWPTPDAVEGAPRVWPLLTAWSAGSTRLLLSQTSERLMSAVVLCQYVTLTLTLLLAFKWRQLRRD